MWGLLLPGRQMPAAGPTENVALPPTPRARPELALGGGKLWMNALGALGENDTTIRKIRQPFVTMRPLYA